MKKRNFWRLSGAAVLAGLVSLNTSTISAEEDAQKPSGAEAPVSESAAPAPKLTAEPSRPARLEALANRLAFGADRVEKVWLGKDGAQHLALFQPPATADAHGAVIIILASGKILERSEFSQTVRRTLADGDWASLVVQSEQMTAGKALPLDAAQVSNLFAEALAYAQQQSYSKFVLVADGEIASHLWPVVQSENQALMGFVGIDAWEVEDFEPKIPVLNVANTVVPGAVTSARKRFNRVKRAPSAACEVYFYDGNLISDTGFGQLISRRIRGWLKRKFVDAS